MRCYHGTPVGGSKVDAAMFLSGRSALVSYANQGHMEQVAECCSSFILDNGAWSAFQKGKQPDWDLYYEDFVYRWGVHPGFDWHIIPDVIGGTEDDNWRLIYKYHKQAEKFMGVPVFHLHESTDYHLERLVNNFPRIAIGSSGLWKNPGTPSWHARMAEVMAVCCESDGTPRCKLHGLRQMDKAIYKRYPYASVDSCNATRNNGVVAERWQDGYMPPEAWQRATVIAWTVEGTNSPAKWLKPEQETFDLQSCGDL